MIRGRKEGSNYSTWFIGFDHELPSNSPVASARLPSSSRSTGSRPVSRAGSVDTLNLLSSSPSPSASSHARRLGSRTPEPSKPSRATDLGKPRTPDPVRARAKWNIDSHGKGKVKKDTRDIYKHAFDSARKAEEYKFKAKFDVLLNDLHQTLDTQSPHGLTDSFASTSYGEVMLSFRGRVKDLLIGFSQRLQLAYESFETRDSPEDHSQHVKQHVSRFLEDLLGESLDLTSDEAVSDLSSLSDDSANDRHAFEDQIAQAVVSKILENHRREVHNSLRQDRRLGGHLNSPVLVPEALNDDDEDGRQSPAADDIDVKDTDISKDFEDLKNFVQETQSRSKLYDSSLYGTDSPDGEGSLDDSGEEPRNSARAGSGFDTHSRDRDFPPLPDFSEFDQIDFNSGELDPDLLQMNLAVIPEETEEELEEEEASDTHWRENWIFKGQAPSAYDNCGKKRIRGGDNQPQYMMVPQPDEDLTPRVGNRDVDQLSDMSDNDDLTDDDNSFYSRTSEELARISRHKRSSTPPSLASPSLIPSTDILTNHHDALLPEDSLHPKRHTSASASSLHNYSVDLDFEDVSVGTDDFVGPIVEPSMKELKLLEDLVPADEDDPKFVLQPESVTIQEGEPVKLACRVAGTQPIDVFWYREQEEVEELEESEDVELHVDGDRHQATLYNVGRQHAGQYMCIALSDKGKAIKYLTVTVKDNKQELKKPEFLKELKDVEVLEGQSVKFRCKVKGYPQPRINWYKDGNLLRSNRSCRIEKFGNRDYILTIDCATMDDDAEYMVVAKNVAGEVKSTAQVIVEPYADGHPLLTKSRSQSVSTVYTDSESDRTSSTQPDDSLSYTGTAARDSVRSQPRTLVPEDPRVESLVTKVTAARDNMRREAEDMLVTAEELTALNQHLEDMERHLDNLEGRNTSHPSTPPRGQSVDNVDYSTMVDEATAIKMIKEEEEMGEAAKSVRKLTSNALSVLRAAEEIIQSEKNASEHPQPSASSSSSSLQPDYNSSPSSSSFQHPNSPSEEDNNNKAVSPASEMSLSVLTNHSDLNKSVSSGYGTTSSMTSSAMDDADSEMAESAVSQPELLSQLDEFALYLPPLDDDRSGSYREEVSISLSSGPSSKANRARPVGASSASSGTLTNSSSSSSFSSSSSGRTLEPPISTSQSMSNSRDSATPARSARKQPVSSQLKVEVPRDEPDSRLTDMSTGPRDRDGNLVVNFGPKEIDSTTYGRDYEVPGRHKAPEGEVGERKRWSVTLDPYSSAADVVNRRPSLEETEEKIYLTAGKMFNLEDRVQELHSRVDGGGSKSSAHSLSDLEDQVAKTAAQVVRSEKEVTNIERAVNTLQFSPRSSRGSNSSSNSTPRESIDSGVSSFTPERLERPLPVHMVGQTQEEEVPESRAEYDADSGIELPSVSRLRAMFGTNRKEEDAGEGNFKRIHSITARSLSKDQLQKLKDAGNTTLADVVRLKNAQPAQSRSSIQLQNTTGGAPGGRAQQPGRTSLSSSASVTLSPGQHPHHQHHQQKPSAPAAQRQIRTGNLPEPAHYQQLDPTKEPVLIYPELEGQEAYSFPASHPSLRNAGSAPRPKSAVMNTPQSGSSNHTGVQAGASRVRAQSVSEVSGGQELHATPKIRSGCISARAAFWERRIMQGEATDTNVEEEFPEMVQDSEA